MSLPVPIRGPAGSSPVPCRVASPSALTAVNFAGLAIPTAPKPLPIVRGLTVIKAVIRRTVLSVGPTLRRRGFPLCTAT